MVKSGTAAGSQHELTNIHEARTSSFHGADAEEYVAKRGITLIG